MAHHALRNSNVELFCTSTTKDRKEQKNEEKKNRPYRIVRDQCACICAHKRHFQEFRQCDGVNSKHKTPVLVEFPMNARMTSQIISHGVLCDGECQFGFSGCVVLNCGCLWLPANKMRQMMAFNVPGTSTSAAWPIRCLKPTLGTFKIRS